MISMIITNMFFKYQVKNFFGVSIIYKTNGLTNLAALKFRYFSKFPLEQIHHQARGFYCMQYVHTCGLGIICLIISQFLVTKK